MRFDKDSFDYFENIIHPNIVANKNHYLKNRLYIFKPYHGCSYRNKNGTHKLIDFKRGHQCITPTSKRYWKKKTSEVDWFQENFIIQDICQMLI